MSGYAPGVLPRLLLLIAVLLMPLGMTAAPAAAADHHHRASIPMQHCPEQGTKHQSKGAFGECTMACASALPVADRLHEERMPYSRLFVTETPVRELHGLHPETATPPPRIA